MQEYRVSDYDFVVKIIQYLEQSCGIVFFITTKDFDILYNWWEKSIPVKIIKESLLNVVERWKKRNKKIVSFSNFSYEVKKNFNTYMQFHVGTENQASSAQITPMQEVEKYLKQLPAPMQFVKQELELIFQKIKEKKPVDLDSFYEKLNNQFKDNNELNLKVKVFKRSLSPELQTPEIEQRYRLNYIINN